MHIPWAFVHSISFSRAFSLASGVLDDSLLKIVILFVLRVRRGRLMMAASVVSVRMGTGSVTPRFAKPSVRMGVSGLRMMGVIFVSVRKDVGTVANAIAKSRVAKAETFTA